MIKKQMTQDSTTSIFRSARQFLGGTVISRFTGMMRDIALAFAFGTQSSLAAFLVAFRFANLIRRLFGEGAMQTAFIPHFEELRDSSPLRACRFFSHLYTLISLGLALFIPMLMLGLFGVYSYGTLSAGNQEIIFLMIVMMPSLLFICLYGLNSSLLQCEKIYFTPSVAPAIFNVVWIASALALKTFPVKTAMPWMAVTIIFAAFFQWFTTVPPTLRALKEHGHLSLWKGIDFHSNDLVALGKPLMLGIFGVAGTQLNSFLDAIFARYAHLEGPAYLWYAIRIQQLPLALFGIAISGALLPPLSRALKAGDLNKFRQFFHAACLRILTLMIPTTLSFIVLGDSLINLIYGHGSFSAQSTVNTTICLWAYALGLVPMALVLILAPTFYAQKNYTTPTVATTASVLVNIALNTLFVFGFHWGSMSIALATSISAWVNFALLYYYLWEEETESYSFLSMKLLFASLTACFGVIAIEILFLGGSTERAILAGEIPNYSRNLLHQLLRMGTEALTFVLFLGAGMWVFSKELYSQYHQELKR